jgi:uncharacterized membrane protein
MMAFARTAIRLLYNAMAAYHPQIVHFAITLLVVGVTFRAVSLIPYPALAGPSALVLIVLGTGAAALAVNSGDAAHDAVQRMPGAGVAVAAHEEWGRRTLTVFMGVIAIEAVGLMLFRSPRRRHAYLASTVVGLVGLVCVYQAGALGGRLVYSYAGGVGTRSGDPADVERLLLAGLYQQAQVERRAGHRAQAAALIAQAAERFPTDTDVQLAAAQSLLLDRQDPTAALAKLKEIAVAREDRALRIQHGLLTADALEAAGQRDGAAALVQGLLTDYPDERRLQQRLGTLKKTR